MAGVLISIIDLVWPHTFSTVLEVYYGTPYDRHVILEESSDVRYRKRTSRSLEDLPGLGSRILRRLSSKARDNSMPQTHRGSSSNAVAQHMGSSSGLGGGSSSMGHHQVAHMSHGHHSSSAGGGGIENKAYQADVPKSPWRYPFRRAQQIQAHPMHMQRTMSQDSGSSIASAAIQISPLHKHALSRMLPYVLCDLKQI